MDVVLVSDDYKMTTTREKAGLAGTCPPSTFIQDLSNDVTGKHASKLRSLARRIKCRDAICNQRGGRIRYPRKLTWLVESLLSTRPPIPQQNEGEMHNEIEASIKL